MQSTNWLGPSNEWIPTPVIDLPLVLAGPILRKVTKSQVSVWIVLKSNIQLSLKIYKEGSETPVIIGESELPNKLGEHIYVTCLTVGIKDVNVLDSSIKYGYDIFFDGIGTLDTDGVLGPVGAAGIGLLTYTESPDFGTKEKLPSFVLPQSDLNHVRVLHGSCRKPHGEGYDAMPIFDQIINDTIEKTLIETLPRPQMLFLTGDQIYGDDVADSLLYMIRAYSTTLFGWDEWHIDASNSDNLKPGNRHKYIIDMLNVDTKISSSKSQLMGFSEYVLMYIMAWNPSLWNGDTPNFVNVHTQEGFELEKWKTFRNEGLRLAKFSRTLNKVQKVLANIPTYMIFDDHEIIDDWFINNEWTENVLNGYTSTSLIPPFLTTTTSLAKRIIQNGMSAFAICQGWGNTPEQFENGEPGHKLLGYYKTIAENNNAINIIENYTLWDTSISEIVLPLLVEDSDSQRRLVHQIGGLKYHWYYEADNFEVIGLDSRTMRVFRKGNEEGKYPGLLSDEAIDEQINNVSENRKELTMLIAGAPIYGVPEIEIKIIKWKGLIGGVTGGDMESWNLDENCRQGVLSALASRALVTIPVDPIVGPVRNHKVIILSGDVHYGFTNKIKYSATETFRYGYGNVSMTIAQCCASSSKNQTSYKDPVIDDITQAFTKAQHVKNLNDSPKVNNPIYYGYNNHDGNAIVELFVFGGESAGLKGNPIMVISTEIDKASDGNSGAILTPDEDWKIEHISLKSILAKDKYGDYNLSSGTTHTLQDYLQLSRNHEHNYSSGGDGGQYIVGLNVVGDIVLQWDNSTKRVNHRLWWRNKAVDNNVILDGFPLTLHLVNLL